MSDKSFNRTIRVRSTDDTTAVLLGVTRTMRAFRMEMIQLNRVLDVLADEEVMAGVAAGDMAAMMQLAIPVVGVIAAGISMAAGARITAARASIPVGQTAPGQVRGITESGIMHVDAGEIIGRPNVAASPTAGITAPQNTVGAMGGRDSPGSFQFNFFDSKMSYKADVQDVVNQMYDMWYQQITRYKSS